MMSKTSRKAPHTPVPEHKKQTCDGRSPYFKFGLKVVLLAVAMYALTPQLLFGLSWAGSVWSKGTCAPKVQVANGTYAGAHHRDYAQDFFLGMPYAKVPERFTIAKSLTETWDGVHRATEYPPHCVGYGGDQIGYEQSEDCLYLNVVRPAGIDESADLPVAVWIHGGGLEMGGSADKRYNLSFIVDHSVQMGTPIIGVSLNYRLSAYGFLSSKQALDDGAANIGFRDQRLALNWVSENIGAFGGSADKVTIFGESSGAESVTAQMLAYNGRDDGLFRGAIGQSGIGGMIARRPAGFNDTDHGQTTYDALVRATSCTGLVGSPESLSCLRNAPFEEINNALNGTGLGSWPPALDGDFFQDFISNQLDSGHFVQVPLLTGTNSDEGTGFGTHRGPNGGGINTDDELANALSMLLSGENTDQTVPELVEELMVLYPNDQAVGIPSLETWDHIIQPGDEFAERFGMQFRRVSALIGDYLMHYTRRRANLVWSSQNVPSYAYRFNVVPNGIDDFYGSVHFQEVAFMFLNFEGRGYAVNPFGGDDKTYIEQAKELSRIMATAWVNFITGLDPNGKDGLQNGIVWPVYNTSTGVGKDVVWDLGEVHVESDDWREDGIVWFIEHALSVFGN